MHRPHLSSHYGMPLRMVLLKAVWRIPQRLIGSQNLILQKNPLGQKLQGTRSIKGLEHLFNVILIQKLIFQFGIFHSVQPNHPFKIKECNQHDFTNRFFTGNLLISKMVRGTRNTFSKFSIPREWIILSSRIWACFVRLVCLVCLVLFVILSNLV